MLIINETGLLALRAGLGPAGNRYGLEHLRVESIPEEAKLIGCHVVRARRVVGGGGGRGSLGMVAVAAVVPGGTKQGDAAAGAAVFQSPADAKVTGVLNVYALDGERGFKVERALQRQPQQRLPLSYAPEGMAHAKVWRKVAGPPNFVGEGGGAGAGESSSSIPTTSNRRFRVERGDALLLWDQDGLVHGYTCWEGDGGGLAVADSSTSRGGGGDDGGINAGGGGGCAVLLTAESRDSLETLIPELKVVGGGVSCLAFDVAEDGDVPARRRRSLLAGYEDAARFYSLDVTSGRGRESAIASIGPVCAVAFNRRPRLMPHDRRVDDSWGGDVAGFACTGFETLAWLLKGGGGSGGRRRPRWCTGTLPLAGAGGDQVTCMDCADFCRDGSSSVVVGTNLGKVAIYGADANPGDETTNNNAALRGASGNGGSGAEEGLAFGLGDADFDESNDGDEPGVPDAAAQSSSRRGESNSMSPRPPGAVPAARQNHSSRRVTERAGSGSVSADFASSNNTNSSSSSPRPLLAERWRRDVPHGVLRVVCGDFNHDGVRELIVVTKRSVHVFHPDYREEADRFAKTMYALKMLQPKEDEEEEEEDEMRDDSLSTASEGDE